ncbi:hypothetical protein MIND_00521600 [Mycena indigotica]|uniref:Uncharacterized protein n=1 Tax=Mycena indigotica TaxID=2126181 RepID=A0A8H6W735_9AGAR|nr:uncharacterized protein MIND_00521600 [Mycena indigotica]KAF7307277.1 hypothetical protein MIND_00521600 [Mycena indigotica]
MLIKLSPPASATPTPTILFALSFPELPLSLPIPPAWAAQLARLAADDLEAPPSMHALDRAAAFPSLLGEVLFDLPNNQVVCSFLDGKVEEWALTQECADMLAKVIVDVEESGRAEQRARDWQRAVEEDKVRQQEKEQQKEAARRASLEREAELERQFAAKRKDNNYKEQVLNSPPPSLKGTKSTKNRLVRSRSLLMALVATFTPSGSSNTSPPSSPTRDSTDRSPSPFRKLTRRGSFASKETVPQEERPLTPPPTHNLETPPSSAPPSAPSSAFSKQQNETPRLSALITERREELSPRLLRRRARSTLVDSFRAHVLPVLATKVGLFENINPSFQPVLLSDETPTLFKRAGGGYHAWVARSMLRRAEDRMRELEAQFPSLLSTRYLNELELSPQPFSPNSISFPTSPTRQATFEPWSSDESESDSEDESECELVVDSESDSDGSSVHTPESGHTTIGVSFTGHAIESSTSSNSSYFTCADDPEAESQDAVSPLTGSHIRRPAQAQSPTHSRTPSNAAHTRQASSSSAKREQRRAQKAAHAEHAAFVRMTARLRSVLAQSAASRQLVAMQKDETDRVREGRGLRRAWLDRRRGFKTSEMVQVFRPSGLGRSTWGLDDIMKELPPPPYDDVVLKTTLHVATSPTSPTTITGRRPRPSPPIQRAKTLAALEIDVELEHVEMDAAELDIEVDLERLDFTDSLDVESMGLDIEVDDVLKSRCRPAGVKARVESWERRRTVALERA